MPDNKKTGEATNEEKVLFFEKLVKEIMMKGFSRKKVECAVEWSAFFVNPRMPSQVGEDIIIVAIIDDMLVAGVVLDPGRVSPNIRLKYLCDKFGYQEITVGTLLGAHKKIDALGTNALELATELSRAYHNI